MYTHISKKKKVTKVANYRYICTKIPSLDFVLSVPMVVHTIAGLLRYLSLSITIQCLFSPSFSVNDIIIDQEKWPSRHHSSRRKRHPRRRAGSVSFFTWTGGRIQTRINYQVGPVRKVSGFSKKKKWRILELSTDRLL